MTPENQTQNNQNPNNQASTNRALTNHAPNNQTLTDRASNNQTLNNHAPTDHTPSNQTQSNQTLTDRTPTNQTLNNQALTDRTPTNQTSTTQPQEPRQKAIALQYNPEDHAPKLMAKGAGFVAEKILETAKNAQIPIHKDANLVEELTRLDLGMHIPPELYEIVAQILIFICDLDKLEAKTNPQTTQNPNAKKPSTESPAAEVHLSKTNQ